MRGQCFGFVFCLPNCHSTLSARDSTMSNQAQQSQSLSDQDFKDKYVAWFKRCHGRKPYFDIPPHQIEFARYLLEQRQVDAGEGEA
jgi:hypothetical protein